MAAEKLGPDARINNNSHARLRRISL
jgi:hypothetical protein